MAHERRIGNVESVTRAGFVYDYRGSRSFSLQNQKELKASVSILPNSFELSSEGQSLLIDIEVDNIGEISAKTSPLNSQKKLNGQTPRLYNDAFTFMFRVANTLGIPVNYRLTSKDPDMKLWMIKPVKYGGIFGSEDKIRPTVGGGIEAIKRFEPISSNGHHK